MSVCFDLTLSATQHHDVFHSTVVCKIRTSVSTVYAIVFYTIILPPPREGFGFGREAQVKNFTYPTTNILMLLNTIVMNNCSNVDDMEGGAAQRPSHMRCERRGAMTMASPAYISSVFMSCDESGMEQNSLFPFSCSPSRKRSLGESDSSHGCENARDVKRRGSVDR